MLLQFVYTVVGNPISQVDVCSPGLVVYLVKKQTGQYQDLWQTGQMSLDRDGILHVEPPNPHFDSILPRNTQLAVTQQCVAS
jgi:hypothetical protein